MFLKLTPPPPTGQAAAAAAASMGVPAFFRWLVQKYPKLVVDVMQPASTVEVDGQTVDVSIDTSRRNPQGREFDNLYLDMNSSIIHPCAHPEGQVPPPSHLALPPPSTDVSRSQPPPQRKTCWWPS